MSDKPTKSKVQEKILSGLECDSNRTWAHMIIDRIDMYFPDLFAPESDPVEELLKYMCKWCIDYDSQPYLCKADYGCECITKREALRACVADLRKRAEGK